MLILFSIASFLHVNPWLIHVNVWQKPLQYCKVISLQLIKLNEKKDFLMWTILKHLLNSLLYCFCFIFWVFGHKAREILFPQPGTKAALPAMEGEVLTPAPPGKSHQLFIQMKCSILMAKKLLNCMTTVCTFWHLAVNSVFKLQLEKKQSFLIFE